MFFFGPSIWEKFLQNAQRFLYLLCFYQFSQKLGSKLTVFISSEDHDLFLYSLVQKKRINKGFSFKGFKVRKAFADTDKANGDLHLFNQCKNNPTFGGAI